jgi:choline dehydrogenase-like flavoprotein
VSLEPSAASGTAATTFELEPPEELEAYRQATRDGIGDDMRSPPSRHDAAAVAARPFYDLVTRQEQAPNPASRVTLSSERDALGVPRARFDWQFTALDKRSMRTLYLTLGREFGQRGIGRVQLRDWLLTGDESWPSFVSGGWHDMGGTRMHDNPKQGVVDADCRVHGLSNLHIAGAGVFPTAGAANPTLTIVAMALRLADRLKGLLS